MIRHGTKHRVHVRVFLVVSSTASSSFRVHTTVIQMRKFKMMAWHTVDVDVDLVAARRGDTNTNEKKFGRQFDVSEDSLYTPPPSIHIHSTLASAQPPRLPRTSAQHIIPLTIYKSKNCILSRTTYYSIRVCNVHCVHRHQLIVEICKKKYTFLTAATDTHSEKKCFFFLSLSPVRWNGFCAVANRHRSSKVCV